MAGNASNQDLFESIVLPLGNPTLHAPLDLMGKRGSCLKPFQDNLSFWPMLLPSQLRRVPRPCHANPDQHTMLLNNQCDPFCIPVLCYELRPRPGHIIQCQVADRQRLREVQAARGAVARRESVRLHLPLHRDWNLATAPFACEATQWPQTDLRNEFSSSITIRLPLLRKHQHGNTQLARLTGLTEISGKFKSLR